MDSGAGAPVVWDGRGGSRPEQVARRRRLARAAAAVVMAVAVPVVVGSSAGWWTADVEAGGSAGSGGEVAVDGGAAGGAGVGGAGGDGVGSLVADPLDPRGASGTGGDAAAGGEGTAFGSAIDGGLLDADIEAGADCRAGLSGAPIVIGVVVEPGAADGSAGLDGGVRSTPEAPVEVAVARHLADVVNCVGGVLGRPVDVVVADVAGSALAAGSAVAGLVDRGASVIVGPSTVELALRAAEAAGEVPIVVPWSIEPALDDHDRGLFLIDPDVTALADAAARHAIDRGWRRAVVFAGSDPVDDLAVAVFDESFAASGGSVSASLELVVDDVGVVDLEGQLDRLGVGPLSSSPPDVVLVSASAEAVVGLAAELAAVGVEVPVVAVDRRWPSGAWVSGVDGLEVVGRWPVEPGGRAERLWTTIEPVVAVGAGGPDAAGGPGVGPSDPVAAARVADAILVAFRAIEDAGDPDASAVAAQLRVASSIHGVTGPTGVWPDRETNGEARAIPVLRLGPEG